MKMGKDNLATDEHGYTRINAYEDHAMAAGICEVIRVSSVLIRGWVFALWVCLAIVLSCRTAHAEDALHLYNWNNYIAEETVARFEAQCACRVVQDYYSDNEEMLAKLAAGASGYDIIVPTGNAMESLIRQNALRPLDKSKLPNLKNMPILNSKWVMLHLG